jgi:flagellar hook-associated protein 2
VAITFGGIATGLPPNLVDQLVAAERIPITKMEETRSKSESRLKLVGDLETKVTDITKSVGELSNTRGFADLKLISSDPNVVEGAVDPNAAVNGTWSLEVVDLAQRPAAITNGFPDKDRTQIGIGYFKFDTKDGERSVFINSKNNTLDGAAKAINSAHLGVRATVIDDRKDKDTPFKMVISGTEQGEDNDVHYPTLYFLDGDQDLYFDQNRPAKNGVIKVDGFEMEIPDNQVKDLIPGVTLDLKNAAPGRNVSLTVKENQDVVSGKIKSFVDGVNAVLSFIQGQNHLTEKSDTSSTLGGDSMLRSIENRLRNLIQNPQYGTGGIKQINELGIAFNRNGLLEFDQNKFNAKLASAPSAVQSFLGGDGFSTGFIPALKREVNGILNSAFGPLANRKRGLQQKIDQTNTQIENKERQLTRKEEQLRRQFSKLEETMSRLKSQGAAVSGFAAQPLMQSGGGMGGLGGGQGG